MEVLEFLGILFLGKLSSPDVSLIESISLTFAIVVGECVVLNCYINV